MRERQLLLTYEGNETEFYGVEYEETEAGVEISKFERIEIILAEGLVLKMSSYDFMAYIPKGEDALFDALNVALTAQLEEDFNEAHYAA